MFMNHEYTYCPPMNITANPQVFGGIKATALARANRLYLTLLNFGRVKVHNLTQLALIFGGPSFSKLA